MKIRYDFVYRLGLGLLLVVVFWSVWANAQSAVATNPPAGQAVAAQFQAVSFGLDSIPILSDHRVLGEPLWKYGASLAYILLAFCVAWLVDLIVIIWLRRVTARTENPVDGLWLKLLRGPIKIVAFVIFVNIGLGVFDWPARAQLMLSRGLIVVVALSVTYVAISVVELLLGIWRRKIVAAQDRVFAELLFPLLNKLAKVVIVVAATMLTADNLGVKITSLLAGLSVGGLALGLAAQDTVANLFGALAIISDKPFHLGDLIRVEAVEGTVESIGLRSTRIRNADGHHITIPNKTMGNAIITNITRRPTIRTEMNLSLACDTPVDKVKRATTMLEEIFRADAKTRDVLISFNKFTASALNVYIEHTWDGVAWKEYMARMQAWNLQIKQRFEAEGIELAFPTQTVHLKTDFKAEAGGGKTMVAGK
jgi:MscS family membrane protein